MSTSQSSKSKVSCQHQSRRVGAFGASWGPIPLWPTRSSPAVTTSGCDIRLENIRNIKIWAVRSISLTCGWPRWWMSNWLQIFPGHPVVAKRFSLARDHLRINKSPHENVLSTWMQKKLLNWPVLGAWGHKIQVKICFLLVKNENNKERINFSYLNNRALSIWAGLFSCG